MATQLLCVFSLGIAAALRSNEVYVFLDDAAAAAAKSCEKSLIRDGIPVPGTGGFFVYSDLMTNKGLFEAGKAYQGNTRGDQTAQGSYFVYILIIFAILLSLLYSAISQRKL